MLTGNLSSLLIIREAALNPAVDGQWPETAEDWNGFITAITFNDY